MDTKQSEQILFLTEAAVKKVKAMMESQQKEGYGLRFGVVPGGCAGLSYELSFQKTFFENDHVIEQDGLKIYVNDESVAFIKGTKIDYIDTLKESGFKYYNPNAKSSCGCGTSFS